MFVADQEFGGARRTCSSATGIRQLNTRILKAQSDAGFSTETYVGCVEDVLFFVDLKNDILTLWHFYRELILGVRYQKSLRSTTKTEMTMTSPSSQGGPPECHRFRPTRPRCWISAVLRPGECRTRRYRARRNRSWRHGANLKRSHS